MSSPPRSISLSIDWVAKVMIGLLMAIGLMVAWEIRELRKDARDDLAQVRGEVVELRLLVIAALGGLEAVAGGDPSTIERSGGGSQ